MTHAHGAGVINFCAVLTPTSTICNVLTLGLNAADIDYDILVIVNQGG
jgi:hypothetical protein